MFPKAKNPNAKFTDSDSLGGGGAGPRESVAPLKTKGRAHYAETMKIAEEIMDRRSELFRRLADA